MLLMHHVADAGDVSTRTRKAGDKTHPDGVGDTHHHDGNCRGRLSCSDDRWCGPSDDNVCLALDKLREITIRERRLSWQANIQTQIPPLDIATFVQTITQRAQDLSCRLHRRQKSDPRLPALGKRLRKKDRRYCANAGGHARAANRSDEVAAPHGCLSQLSRCVIAAGG
jgi:hypothetical protein